MTTLTTDPTAAELEAILLARDFRADDRVIQIGANLPTARAAAVLANLTTHPDARILLGYSVESLAGGRPVPPVAPLSFHARGPEQGEALMHQRTVFDDISRPDVFFVGGLEVDRRGNVNLLGIPDGARGWKVRGPGAVALASMSTSCRGYYILMGRHDPRTFVERVASITALGDRTVRAELGFPGGGPRLLLSPLGAFDFDETDGELRLRTTHPGVSVDEVLAATGFPLRVADDVRPTTPPTVDELTALRTRVDPDGVLRGA
jgi:glutaconate CoA-transferase subunit B